MISSREFIRQSLELHLFFARIMKEHAFFLELGFTQRDKIFKQQADNFRKAFEKFLLQVTTLSMGIVSEEVLDSGEIVTPYTVAAEVASSNYTGVKIPIKLTRMEEKLIGGNLNAYSSIQALEHNIIILNNTAMNLIASLIKFKSTVLVNVNSCSMFTTNYPLLIHHLIMEAEHYLKMVQKLQKREDMKMKKHELEHEEFWNHIMGEHAKFIRGTLDPSEEELIVKANDFANEFDFLTEEAKESHGDEELIDKITDESYHATEALNEFKLQGVKGILSCKLKSIIMPLMADHVYRESNHYIRMLMKMELD